MKILAIDDENIALKSLVSSITKAVPDAEIFSFRSAIEGVDFCNTHKIDIAFLDISMREISGITVAKMLKEKNPTINIIFSTGYDEYREDAFDMHASGYITKPITPEKVKKEIDDLRHPIQTESLAAAKKLLKIQCFGNFEVYDMSGKPLHFERQKSKELFAYLVFRHGASCTNKEIASILFEDGFYDKKQQIYLQKIISSMIKTLRDLNCEEVINRAYNCLGIMIDLVDCDYYKAIETRDNSAYFGEFIAQYSWAEEFNYYFEN